MVKGSSGKVPHELALFNWSFIYEGSWRYATGEDQMVFYTALPLKF